MDSGQFTNPKSGITNLMIASAQDLIPELQTYLSQSIDLNQQDFEGNTALIYAVANNHLQAAELLLDSGANPNLANQGEGSPLAYALSNGNRKMAQVLVHSGAELFEPKFPLHPKAPKIIRDLENIPIINDCQNQKDFVTMEPLHPRGTIVIDWNGKKYCYDLRTLRQSIRSQKGGIYGILGEKPYEEYFFVYSIYPLNDYIDVHSGNLILSTENRKYKADLLLKDLRINFVDQPVYTLVPE